MGVAGGRGGAGRAAVALRPGCGSAAERCGFEARPGPAALCPFPAMALLRAAALPADGPPAWLPTHVQVTVVRARGLRCKGGGGGGKAGSSDAYTIIQLGREKYCTSVAEKSGGCPEWKEECAFELPPTEPGAEAALLLTVMHRALVGMDRFLGMARVPLRAAGLQGRAAEER